MQSSSKNFEELFSVQYLLLMEILSFLKRRSYMISVLMKDNC